MKILSSTSGLSWRNGWPYESKALVAAMPGAICGLNPWRSPIDVYVDKTNEKIEAEVETEAMRVGTDLEDYVARRFCEATGKKVHRKNVMMQSEEYPFMLANVDRIVTGEKALLECKTANAYAAEQWSDGKCPESYEIQWPPLYGGHRYGESISGLPDYGHRLCDLRDRQRRRIDTEPLSDRKRFLGESRTGKTDAAAGRIRICRQCHQRDVHRLRKRKYWNCRS